MDQRGRIRISIETVREQYALDQYRSDRAIIQAPFGQEHYDEGIKRLTGSRAVTKLAKRGSILVIIITSKATEIGILPDWMQCIQVGKIPDWPEHPRYQSRFFKWGIPFLFRSIKCSIWQDSDLLVTNKIKKLNRVFKLAEEYHFVCTKHELRSGWKQEHDAISRWRYLSKEKLERQYDFFVKNNIPPDGPIYQTNYLARNHDHIFDDFHMEILHQMASFSERDQLGMVYAMHKTSMMPYALSSGDILHGHTEMRLNINTITFVDPGAVSLDKVRSMLKSSSLRKIGSLSEVSFLIKGLFEFIVFKMCFLLKVW